MTEQYQPPTPEEIAAALVLLSAADLAEMRGILMEIERDNAGDPFGRTVDLMQRSLQSVISEKPYADALNLCARAAVADGQLTQAVIDETIAFAERQFVDEAGPPSED